MLILQMRKSKSGRLSNLLIGQAAIKRQSQDWNQGLSASICFSLYQATLSLDEIEFTGDREII